MMSFGGPERAGGGVPPFRNPTSVPENTPQSITSPVPSVIPERGRAALPNIPAQIPPHHADRQLPHIDFT